MKKLLLTGFEPFLDFPFNPTTAITETLNGETINEFKIVGEILSVNFQESGKQLIKLIDNHQPDVVISLGLAAGRNCVTPERIAINCNEGPVDNHGNKRNGEKIIAEGPDGYFSTLPIKDIVEKLNHSELPATVSNSAGAYLCNNVMYHGLHYFKQHHSTSRSGFIHLPASHLLAVEKNIPSWSQQDLKRAVRLAISCL